MLCLDSTSVSVEGEGLVLPWQCYSDGFSRLRRFPSLREMCAALGISPTLVIDSIEYNDGTLGAFHFVYL